VKHTLEADILVDIGPVHALTATDETEVLALFSRSIAEPPGPGEGDGDGTTVAEASDELILGHLNGSNDRVGVSRSVGARHLESPSGALGSASGYG
jgi:hypothetical protein